MTESNLPKVPPLETPKPVRPWDLLNANKQRVGQQLKEERLEICRSCPFYRKKTHQCVKCGCFMDLKTQLADAYCPIGKWHNVEVSFKTEQ